MAQAPVDKNKKAAALRYDLNKDSAPVAVAIGEGRVAEKIIETARASDVPVVQDESLAQALSRMGVGDQIPLELYSVVAQILVFLNTVDGDYRQKTLTMQQIRGE